MTDFDPRRADAFVFEVPYLDGDWIHLPYRYPDGPRLVERVRFPGASLAALERDESAARRALELCHWLAGVSYYKAGAPPHLVFEGRRPDPQAAELLRAVYTRGLAEFGHVNGLDLRRRLAPITPGVAHPAAPPLGLGDRALVALGGGKDSLVSVEALKRAGRRLSTFWVGRSSLIEACARASGLPWINVERELAPELFELNRRGAYNGHVPVTAINSALAVLAAVLYGYRDVVFSNEASAAAPNLSHDDWDVNHQWSKGPEFEAAFAAYVQSQIAADLRYYSLLRRYSELAVTARFARCGAYHALFSSCNRNFRLLGERPDARWCGQCPKCRFTFLALAPFLPKPKLVAIFGRNLLDDPEQRPGYDALLEFDGQHKPFECVGEAAESRAAMAFLATRPDWREDAVVAHYADRWATLEPPPSAAWSTLLRPQGPPHAPEALDEYVDQLASY